MLLTFFDLCILPAGSIVFMNLQYFLQQEEGNTSSKKRDRAGSRSRSVDNDEGTMPRRRSRRLSRGSSAEPSDGEEENGRMKEAPKLETIAEIKETPEKKRDAEPCDRKTPESTSSSKSKDQPADDRKEESEAVKCPTTASGGITPTTTNDISDPSPERKAPSKESSDVESNCNRKSRSPKRRVSKSPSVSPEPKKMKSSSSSSPNRRSSSSPVKEEIKRKLSLSPEEGRKRFSKTSPSTELRQSKKSPDMSKRKHSPIVLKGLDGSEKRSVVPTSNILLPIHVSFQ